MLFRMAISCAPYYLGPFPCYLFSSRCYFACHVSLSNSSGSPRRRQRHATHKKSKLRYIVSSPQYGLSVYLIQTSALHTRWPQTYVTMAMYTPANMCHAHLRVCSYDHRWRFTPVFFSGDLSGSRADVRAEDRVARVAAPASFSLPLSPDPSSFSFS